MSTMHHTRLRLRLRIACSVSSLLLALAPCGKAAGVGSAPGGSEISAEVSSAPDLALAEVYEQGVALGDYWLSEKLDGVRAFWNGRQLISRGGHHIKAPTDFIRGFPAEALDGELWLGRGRFEETSGMVRRLDPDPDDWRHMRYLVFDLPGAHGDFEERLRRLRQLVQSAENPRLQAVEQRRVRDHAALVAELARVNAAGGEGLMLRRNSAPYRGGRNADLLKVKNHLDAEAVVIGHVPGKGKYQGLLGSLRVRDPQGREFRVGSGLSDSERRDPPAIGTTITYRYRGRTERGIPRFATFVRVRDDVGLSVPADADNSGGN